MNPSRDPGLPHGEPGFFVHTAQKLPHLAACFLHLSRKTVHHHAHIPFPQPQSGVRIIAVSFQGAVSPSQYRLHSSRRSATPEQPQPLDLIPACGFHRLFGNLCPCILQAKFLPGHPRAALIGEIIHHSSALPNDSPRQSQVRHQERARLSRQSPPQDRIYIGRRFKNDTERLEKPFELYTQMTAKQPATK